MKTFLECWAGAATALFAQALTGEPELMESLPKPLAAESFGFAATIAGDLTGRFAVMLDGTLIESALVGEGMDQKAGWGELLREVAESAVGELLAAAGLKCSIEKFEPTFGESKVSCAFQLKTGERGWTVLVRDEVSLAQKQVKAGTARADAGKPGPKLGSDPAVAPGAAPASASTPDPGLGSGSMTSGVELLLDVELDASLRFGCREMPLGEILDLGPGDVVQLDRHISDPVDLIVGDKIVARGEVVLINGNFGLRITEVAAPRKRLESIRCLF
jgi:flagellar motor switch protein FliN